MNTETHTNNAIGQYRPNLTFYHPNAKGTGSAVSMNLHPAHDRVDGSIMMRVANQMTVGNRMGPNPVYPRFDWENSINVKLDFNDLCKMLQVLRGECESIDGDHGLYHRSPAGATSIRLRHLLEPVQGYSLEVYRTPKSGDNEQRAHVLFSAAESLGLCEAISGSLSVVAFGIPMLVAHDTSAYEAQVRGVCDVAES